MSLKKKKNFKLVGIQRAKVVQPKRQKRVLKPGTQKTVKQLLGELYADKVYLEKLLDDDHIVRANTIYGEAIWSLANNGLDFLDSRTEFWRQQKPIYARKNNFSTDPSNSKVNNVLKELEAIDNWQTNGNPKKVIQKSNELLEYIKSSKMQQSKEIVANIHSYIGNARLELGNYDAALEAHQKDLDMSTEIDNKEGISRSYENIGRVYARNGKYSQAIAVWEKKLPLAQTDMEKAWLYHEIGRCELELGKYEVSKDYGKRSLKCAENIDDEVWQLNATVLIAQSEVKIGTLSSLNSAVENFQKALKMTEKQNDNNAGNAITKALNDCHQKLEKLSHLSEGDARDSIKSPSKSIKEEDEPVEEKTEEPKKDDIKSPEPEKEPEPVVETKQEVAEEETETNGVSKYRIEVKTSDTEASGTDANVTITIVGTSDTLYDQPLKNNVSGKDAFERGDLNVFWIESNKNLGKIQRVTVSHDGKGFGSGFLMDYVQVNFEDVTYQFNCGSWLEVDDDDKCEKTLELTDEREDRSSNYTQ